MQNYISLIKPGIVIGNLTSTISGFLMASKGNISYIALLYISIGMSLIIAASCVYNNIIDRDIDSIMTRTNNRPLARKNSFSVKKSLFFAIILNILGFLLLINVHNFLIILLTIIGILVYIIIYSLWLKRKSMYSTVIGSISGAMPPIIGYCAVTYRLDIGALILLLIFIFWQISHSYSITIFRLYDYQAALIPTLTIKKGIILTKKHIIICIIGFSCATALLTVVGYTSTVFFYIISTINVIWLYIGLHQYHLINNDFLWSKKMFFLSILIIMLFNLLLSIDSCFIHNKNYCCFY